MIHASNVARFFFDRIKQSLVASVGLLLFSFGFYLQLVANVGLASWQCLNQGLSMSLSITFGQASILVSVFVVIADFLLHEPIGIGTILDAFLVGWGTDFFIWLDLIPYQTNFGAGLAVMALAIVIMSIAQSIHMKEGLSCGPRDALMVAIGKRLPMVSVGTVCIVMSLIVLTIGYFLGGSIGLGTVINLFGAGIIMDAVFHLLHFDPRVIKHESLWETTVEFAKAWNGDCKKRQS